MSILVQLLIGREIARQRGVSDSSEQLRVGVMAAAMGSPILGAVVASAAAEGLATPKRPGPIDGEKPKPVGDAAPAVPAPADEPKKRGGSA
jgi:hypothetical protein